jgi:glycosyltransferase involved in cell wall biosynthesis
VAQSDVERVHAVALGRTGARKGSYDVVSAVGAHDKTVRGRPAPVTMAVASVGEAVSDRVTGIVVQPDSPDQITDALTAVVTDEGLRVRLGSAARGRAGDFGLQRWYESLARLWTDLATFDRSLAVR